MFYRIEIDCCLENDLCCTTELEYVFDYSISKGFLCYSYVDCLDKVCYSSLDISNAIDVRFIKYSQGN